MVIQAVELAERYGVDFSQTFAYQYLLADHRAIALPGMKKIKLSDWSLFVGKKLPHFTFQPKNGGFRLAFLGVGVDENGEYVTEKLFERIWKKLKSVDAFIDYINQCGGRFVFCIFTDQFKRVYGDASGSMATYYDKKSRTAGCSQFIVLDRELVENTGYPAFSTTAYTPGDYFAFTRTADVYSRQLLANHYLDLSTWHQIRFWPTDDIEFTMQSDEASLDAQLDIIISRHQQIIGAITQNNSRTFLPLSGGTDSRTLLALSKPFLDKIECYSHVKGRTSRTDLNVALKLTRAMGQKLRIIDYVKDPNVKLSLMDLHKETLTMSLAQGLLDPNSKREEGLVDTMVALPEEGIVLRGQIVNIMKCYSFIPEAIEHHLYDFENPVSSRVAIRALKLPWTDRKDFQFLATQYDQWLNGLPEKARQRAMDFVLVEQHRSHSMGRFFNSLTKGFYMAPSCDRAIIQAMIRIPPHLRYHLYIQDMVIEKTAPEILDVEYNKVLSNARNRMSTLSLADQFKRLPSVA